MFRKEPSIVKNCSVLSEKQNSKFAAQDTNTSDHLQSIYQEQPYSGLLGIESQCKIFSVRKIEGNFSALKSREYDPVKRLEDRVEKLEEKLEKTQKYYARKLNKLKKKLLQEDNQKAFLQEELTLVKMEMAKNLSLMSDLYQLIQEKNKENISSSPIRVSKSPHRKYLSPPLFRKNRLKQCNELK